MKVAIISNTSWYIYNFRLNHILALKKAGHDVVAVSPKKDKYSKLMEELKIQHYTFEMSGAGTNPLHEIKSIISLVKILKNQEIQIILSNTPKANIYASFAAKIIGIRILPNVSGLGRVFIKKSILTPIVRILYSLSFKKADFVYFQNTDDCDFFVKNHMIKAVQAKLIPGSGVDLNRFRPIPQPVNIPFTFLLLARLLWDKGIAEYINAARIIKKQYPNTKFQLLGQLNIENPSSIHKSFIDTWQQEGIVDYLGTTDDVIPYIKSSHCVVLPSYREGTPRSLLEAAAMGRPIITTDVVGCRNVIDDGITGYLCKVKDPDNLATKMKTMLELPNHERELMGLAGRKKMENQFDEKIVIDSYVQAIDSLTKTS